MISSCSLTVSRRFRPGCTTCLFNSVEFGVPISIKRRTHLVTSREIACWSQSWSSILSPSVRPRFLSLGLSVPCISPPFPARRLRCPPSHHLSKLSRPSLTSETDFPFSRSDARSRNLAVL
jgi:hypothetical protein